MSRIYELPRQCGKTINIEDLYKKMEELHHESLEETKEQKFDPYITNQTFKFFNEYSNMTLEQFIILWINKREYIYELKELNIVFNKNRRSYTLDTLMKGINSSKSQVIREGNWCGEMEHPRKDILK